MRVQIQPCFDRGGCREVPSSVFRSLALVAMRARRGARPAAAEASFGIEKFTATNCGRRDRRNLCGEAVATSPYSERRTGSRRNPTGRSRPNSGFTQAGGRVPFGVTDFKVNTNPKTAYPNAEPEGAPVNHVRVDVASGLATAPAAVPTCSTARIRQRRTLPGTGFYPAPTCAKATEIGSEKVTLWVAAEHRRRCRSKESFTISNSPKVSPRSTAPRSNCRLRSPPKCSKTNTSRTSKASAKHLESHTESRRGTAVLRAHSDQRQRRMGPGSQGHRRRRLPRLLRSRSQHRRFR